LSAVRPVLVDTTNFIEERDTGGGVEVALPRTGSFDALQQYLAQALP
jgi:hypothetical protein